MHSRFPPNMRTLLAYTLKWLAGWLVLTLAAVALVHQAWLQQEFPTDSALRDEARLAGGAETAGSLGSRAAPE